MRKLLQIFLILFSIILMTVLTKSFAKKLYPDKYKIIRKSFIKSTRLWKKIIWLNAKCIKRLIIEKEPVKKANHDSIFIYSREGELEDIMIEREREFFNIWKSN